MNAISFQNFSPDRNAAAAAVVPGNVLDVLPENVRKAAQDFQAKLLRRQL